MSDCGYEVGECPYCNEIKDDLLETMSGHFRCSDCDDRYVWCSICKEDRHEDDTCRHIFYDGWHGTCAWLGSGSAYANDESWTNMIKTGIMNLLSAVPFAEELRAGILSGEFYLFIISGMIGRPMLEVNGLRSPTGERKFCSFDIGEKIMTAMENDEDDENYVNLAAHWLLTLYKDHTPKANEVTVAWIEEWLASRTDRLITASPHV